MPRPRASVPPEAIRIEDEVWEEAFARREPARRRHARLHAIEGGRPANRALSTEPLEPAPLAPRRPAPRPAAAPRTAPVGVPAEPIDPPRASSSAAEGGVPARRTVTIRGYGAERNPPWPESSRRRPARRVHERAGFKPDRVALWAVMLGILLVLVAIASPHS